MELMVAEEEIRLCLRLCSASLPDSEAVPERAYLVDPVIRRVCGSPHPLRWGSARRTRDHWGRKESTL